MFCVYAFCVVVFTSCLFSVVLVLSCFVCLFADVVRIVCFAGVDMALVSCGLCCSCGRFVFVFGDFPFVRSVVSDIVSYASSSCLFCL